MRGEGAIDQGVFSKWCVTSPLLKSLLGKIALARNRLNRMCHQFFARSNKGDIARYYFCLPCRRVINQGNK
jgi:hypothetical protein